MTGCGPRLDGLVGVYEINYKNVYEILDLRGDGTFHQIVVIKDAAPYAVESNGHYEHLDAIVEFDHFIDVFTPDGYLDKHFSRGGDQAGLALESLWGTQCMEYQSHQSWSLKYFCRIE